MSHEKTAKSPLFFKRRAFAILWSEQGGAMFVQGFDNQETMSNFFYSSPFNLSQQRVKNILIEIADK
jgi:hypothetical protein